MRTLRSTVVAPQHLWISSSARRATGCIRPISTKLSWVAEKIHSRVFSRYGSSSSSIERNGKPVDYGMRLGWHAAPPGERFRGLFHQHADTVRDARHARIACESQERRQSLAVGEFISRTRWAENARRNRRQLAG